MASSSDSKKNSAKAVVKSKDGVEVKDKAPAKSKTASTRRIGSEQSVTRTLLLDTVEKLMLDEGYASVSSRRVAKEVDLKPSLVHYYFPTTDDLFIAVFRRALETELAKADDATEPLEYLMQLWDSYRNSNRTALALEFMALANHRKAIKDEITLSTERIRSRRAERLASMIDMSAIQPAGCSAAGLSVLLIGVARTLVMEEGLGISLGHADAKTAVEHWLKQLALSKPVASLP